ncbi:MAG: hypothetical protein AABX04_01130 [Nanoarchaeota archaeon]
MLEEKLNKMERSEKKSFSLSNLRDLVSNRFYAGVAAVASALILSGCESAQKCTPEQEKTARNYCNDYQGKDICTSCERCECTADSYPEFHCSYDGSSSIGCDDKYDKY